MSTHATKDEIHRLIQAADNPRDKAYLLIMLDIHDSLVENTTVTHSIKSRVESHTDVVTRSRGIWQATAFFLVILEGLFIFEYTRLIDFDRAIQARVSALEVAVEANRVQLLDRDRGR